MTLSREQVIAWVENEQDIAERAAAALGPTIDGRVYRVRADNLSAILTVLQSLATVEQERDEAVKNFETASALAVQRGQAAIALQAERDRLTQEVERLKEVCPHFWCQSCDTEAQRSDEDGCCLSCGAVLVAPKRYLDILKNLVIPSWKAEAQTHQERTEKAEAEATRLRGMWDVLNDTAVTHWAGMATDDAGDSLAELIKSIEETTPSGPAEEGR